MKDWLRSDLRGTGLLLLLLLMLGGAVLYALGQWDRSVSQAWVAYQATVEQALEAGRRYREREDSLKRAQLEAEARADYLAGRAAAAQRRVSMLEAEISEAETVSTAASIAELLPALKLRPIERGLYATDSAGVWHLEGLRLAALKAPLVPRLREQVNLLTEETGFLRVALGFASSRADSSNARVVRLEGLLKEGQKLRQCSILWILPCPSRGLAFVGGVVATVMLVVLTGK